MLVLPRSARLAAWGGSALAGRVSASDAVVAVTGADEPHAVLDAPDGPPAATPEDQLAALLAALSTCGATGLRVVLPAPGDPLGLPGPPAFNVEALDVGEAVLVEGELLLEHGVGRLGLVPDVEEFGSAWEPGAMVTWRVLPCASPPAPDATRLADAERELNLSLAQATRVLADLQVARWREDAADRITAVRDSALGRAQLPPDTDPRAARVATSAARVRAIVALAREDDGAAITGHEAQARSATLREVDAVARRALATAVNAARALQP